MAALAVSIGLPPPKLTTVSAMLLEQRSDPGHRARRHVLAGLLEHRDTSRTERRRHAIEKTRRAQRAAGDDHGALEPAPLQLERETLDRIATGDDSLEAREIELPAIGPHRSGS